MNSKAMKATKKYGVPQKTLKKLIMQKQDYISKILEVSSSADNIKSSI